MAPGPLIPEAVEYWERAAARTDVTTRHLRIAGRHLALRLAGAPLADAILPSLGAHPDVDPARCPDLEIRGWDTASTGIGFPLDARERSRVPGWRRRVASTEAPMSGERLLDQSYEDTFSALGDGIGVHWSLDAAALPFWERAAPLIHVLHWWLRAYDRFVVHAAAVGREGRGVFLVGPSGSGKSTTALACRAAGWQYVGDDYTVLDPEAPRVHHLYRSAKLAQAAEGLVPETRRVAADDRWMYYLDGSADHLDIVGVVVPHVGVGGASTLTRTSSFPALAAMAPSTVNQLVGSGAIDLAAMRRLCAGVPCYSLELGGPPSAVPSVLEGALR